MLKLGGDGLLSVVVQSTKPTAHVIAHWFKHSNPRQIFMIV